VPVFACCLPKGIDTIISGAAFDGAWKERFASSRRARWFGVSG
jgi:hypothetical protein